MMPALLLQHYEYELLVQRRTRLHSHDTAADLYATMPGVLTGAIAEGTRPRKRFQRIPNTENDDPLRKPGPSLPFQRARDVSNGQTQVQGLDASKINGHARRRSTLRDNNRPLLGPRPLESKRYGRLLYIAHDSCYVCW
jgi:hypothetical protein